MYSTQPELQNSPKNYRCTSPDLGTNQVANNDPYVFFLCYNRTSGHKNRPQPAALQLPFTRGLEEVHLGINMKVFCQINKNLQTFDKYANHYIIALKFETNVMYTGTPLKKYNDRDYNHHSSHQHFLPYTQIQ
ncbi:hypothetical protein VNO77_00330 [Canavalia gladiata]|uniref:Uncharacterized protein n=1 Tax=Canavalia gladiata TaxID=3824 RepID=A0AAN9MVN3_CANGL